MLIISMAEIKERKHLEERLRNEIAVGIKAFGFLNNFHWKLLQTLAKNVKTRDSFNDDLSYISKSRNEFLTEKSKIFE